jgi:hypothetical protein
VKPAFSRTRRLGALEVSVRADLADAGLAQQPFGDRGHRLAAVALAAAGRGLAVADLHAARLVDRPVGADVADDRSADGDEPAGRVSGLDRHGQAVRGVIMRPAVGDDQPGQVTGQDGPHRLDGQRFQAQPGRLQGR